MISLILAVAANGVIGRQGDLPWPAIPTDFAWFKQHTVGKPVVMGRKTWDSLPAKFRPLPGRRNIVVSRQSQTLAGAEVATTLHDAFVLAGDAREIMVIGGGDIYRQALALAQRVYLTRLNLPYEGDVTFPLDQLTEWRISQQIPLPEGLGVWQILERPQNA